MSRVQAFRSRRWLCLAGALVICISAGFGYAWSVLQTPIAAAHGWAGGQVALTFTLTVVFSTLTPLFLGGLIRRLPLRGAVALGAVLYGFGIFATGSITALWQLYLFYGVCSGLGCGFIYPAMMAYVVRLFPDRSGFASGLGAAAYGSGAVLWAPVSVALSGALSLGAAFRILGGGFAAVILLSALLLAEPPEGFAQALAPAGAQGAGGAAAPSLRRGEMVRTPAFYLMVCTFTGGLTAGMVVISQASPILQQTLGYPAAAAAAWVSVFSACNMAGRFLWGGVSDKLGIRGTVALIFLVCVASMAALALAHGEAVTLIAMGAAASCYGGFAAVITPLTARMFGPEYLTENYGVMYVVYGLASLIGPNLAVGFQSAAGGSYTGAYLVAAALAAVGLVLSRSIRAGRE